MLEKMKAYFETEYKDMVSYKTNPYREDYTETVRATIQRCLGVAFFVSTQFVDFEDVEAIYQEYWQKLNDLI